MLLIIDFGSQVTQLIARRIRELGIYCEIHPCQRLDGNQIRELNPKAIILSGSPASVEGIDPPVPPVEIYECEVPVLGICYGQQVMAAQLGGKVEASDRREFGRASIRLVPGNESNPILEGLFDGGSEPVWMSHGDRVRNLPPGFISLATSKNSPHAIIANPDRNLIGLQFHPEVYHTVRGNRFLENFVGIAGMPRDWTMSTLLEQSIQQIRDRVGDHRIICAVSGGIDSTVTAALVHRALPGQLTCIFVDNGMLRTNEATDTVRMFREHFNIPLLHVEKQDLFLDKLAGVTQPEDKRKIIGKLFIEVFQECAGGLGDIKFLAQGTLYPDVIESISATGSASSTIKSHHNVGGLPEKLGLELVEPLNELFKDEVRLLGAELGLPETFLKRHPFPGPGLAIRCPGKVTRQKLDILRRADEIFIDQIREAGLYDEIWQAFVTLLPVRSVGVMGDSRTYDRVCVLRAVTSTDGMTADYYPFGHDFLSETAIRIVNEVKGINRVMYDITSKPPGTIEWE